MSILDRLRQQIDMQQKDLILIYSRPNLGKTSLAAQFPSPMFVVDGSDSGYADLVRSGQLENKEPPIVIDDWKSLREATKAIASSAGDLDAETIVFENLGGFERHLVEFGVSEFEKLKGCSRKEAWDKFHLWGGKGFEATRTEFANWVHDVHKILATKNKHGKSMRVVLIGHEGISTEQNVGSEALEESFKKVSLALHKYNLEVIDQNVANIGWLRQAPIVVKGDRGGKALCEDVRELIFYPMPGWGTKNRWKLPAVPIPMGKSAAEGFNNLKQAIGTACVLNKRATEGQGESK